MKKVGSRKAEGGKKRRLRVALCAVITVDGKLDTTDPLPLVLRDFLTLKDGDRLVEDPDQFHALLAARQVNDLYLLVRPRIDGRGTAPTLSGPFTPEFFPRSISCRLRRMKVVDGECFLHYTVARGRKTDASTHG